MRTFLKQLLRRRRSRQPQRRGRTCVLELLEQRVVFSGAADDPTGDDAYSDYCQQNFEIDAQDDAYVVWHDTLYRSESSVLENDQSEHPCAASQTAAIATDVAHGSLSLSSDGTFTYLPDRGYVGNDGFAYAFSDGYQSELASVVITVNNDLPIACNDPLDASGECQADDVLDDEAGTSSYRVHNDHTSKGASSAADYFSRRTVLRNDIDLDSLTAEVVCSVSHGTLAMYGDGSFSYDPDPGYLGPDSFVYQASDGAATDTAIVSLSVEGTQHTRKIVFEETIDSGFVLLGELHQRDCSEQFQPSRLTIDSEQTNSQTAVYVSYEGSHVSEIVHDRPSDSFIDGDGNQYSAVPSTSGWYTDGESRYIRRVSRAIEQADFSEVATIDWSDGSPVSALVVPHSGRAGHAIVPTGWDRLDVYGSHTYYSSGELDLELSLDAPLPFYHRQYMGRLLAEVENAPLTAAGTSVFGEVGAELTAVVAAFSDANKSDQAHSYQATIDWGDGSAPTSSIITGDKGSFVVTGVHTYPAQGSYAFTVTVSDKDGGQVETSGTATISIQAEVAVDDSYTTSHGHKLVATQSVLANDRNVEQGNLTAALVSGAAYGNLNLNTNGTFTYVPNGSYVGDDRFTYRVNNGLQHSDTGSVVITVTNNPPSSAADVFVIPQGRASVLDATANDTDDDGDRLLPQITTSAERGTVSVRANGMIDYSPNAGYTGQDQFEYRASDGFTTGNLAVVTLDISNQSPHANSDGFQVVHDRVLIADVRQNDTDADSDSLHPRIDVPPNNGSARVRDDGLIEYVPNAGFVGFDSLAYRVSDGAADSNSALLTIQVTNNPPTAAADVITLAHDRSATFEIRANDTDQDGDPLQVHVMSQTTHGTLATNTDGSVTYTPQAGFTGQDSFSYAVDDGIVESAPAQVSLV